jgi:hypothetical protein
MLLLPANVPAIIPLLKASTDTICTSTATSCSDELPIAPTFGLLYRTKKLQISPTAWPVSSNILLEPEVSRLYAQKQGGGWDSAIVLAVVTSFMTSGWENA